MQTVSYPLQIRHLILLFSKDFEVIFLLRWNGIIALIMRPRYFFYLISMISVISLISSLQTKFKSFWVSIVTVNMTLMMMIMMMMMKCFCGLVDKQKAFSLISIGNHCQRFSPSQITDTPLAAMNLCSSDNHYTAALN